MICPGTVPTNDLYRPATGDHRLTVNHLCERFGPEHMHDIIARRKLRALAVELGAVPVGMARVNTSNGGEKMASGVLSVPAERWGAWCEAMRVACSPVPVRRKAWVLTSQATGVETMVKDANIVEHFKARGFDVREVVIDAAGEIVEDDLT